MSWPEQTPSADGGDALVEARKAEHLRLTARGDVGTRAAAGWADVHLLHEALPDVDFDAVDLSVVFLGRRLRAPLLIAGMTGGHAAAHEVNAILARAAERHGLAMGVGSQRAALRQEALAATYRVAREQAPSAVLLANVGAPQLIAQASGPPLALQDIHAMVRLIRADALAVHLNGLQECVQPEGDRRAHGIAEAIHTLAQSAGVPVVAKETGAGLARETALRLRDLGVAALDVGGVGGTSFAAVEALRAREQGDARGAALGALLRDWGVPTAVSVVGAMAAGLPVIATGGVRSGLDAAKALALGATLVGVARPLLQAVLEAGDTGVDRWIEQFLHELRAVLFLTGSARPEDLRTRPRVILGPTLAWLEQLGYLAPRVKLGRETPTV